MKRYIILITILWGISSIASAQFFNETLYFIEVGKTVENSNTICYVHFDANGNLIVCDIVKSDARSKYKEGILKEYGVNMNHYITRDYSISSSKYFVYSCPRTQSTYGVVNYKYIMGMPVPQYGWINQRIGGNWYYGISRSEMVTWHTTSESNEAQNKKFYKAISASDLVPKEVHYDFL